MKKFVFFSLLTLLFVSCSTDDSAIDNTNDAALIIEQHNNPQPKAYSQCFNSVWGTVTNVGSLQSPLFRFSGAAYWQASGTSGDPFVVELQLHELADCEDMDVVTGQYTTITFPNLWYSGTPFPYIDLQPVQFPYTCFKWKIVVRNAVRHTTYYCTSSSAWSDSPVN